MPAVRHEFCENSFRRSKLDPVFVRRVLEMAASRGCLSVSLTGGEPLLFKAQLFELLGYARSLGIRYTRTGTNGFVFCEGRRRDTEQRTIELARAIRRANVYTFWISLDSADPRVHEAARGLPGVVQGIRRALPLMHHFNVYPSANLGLNRRMGLNEIPVLSSCVASASMSQAEVFSGHVKQALREFFDSVIDIGFTTANICYPMSFDNEDVKAAYRATATASVVSFSDEERRLLYQTLAQVIQEYRGRIRIFTPLSSLSAIAGQQEAGNNGPHPCRGGIDYYYLSAADRLLYPCGFRGGEPIGSPLDESSWKGRKEEVCLLCDWECFRDPSQMVWPFVSATRHPRKALRWFVGRGFQEKIWRQDWRYYAACGYYTSEAAPKWEDLRRFEVSR